MHGGNPSIMHGYMKDLQFICITYAPYAEVFREVCYVCRSFSELCYLCKFLGSMLHNSTILWFCEQYASIFNTGKYLLTKKFLGCKNERKQDKHPQILSDWFQAAPHILLVQRFSRSSLVERQQLCLLSQQIAGQGFPSTNASKIIILLPLASSQELKEPTPIQVWRRNQLYSGRKHKKVVLQKQRKE